MDELFHKQMFGLQNGWQFLSNFLKVTLELIFSIDFSRFQQQVLLNLLFDVHYYLFTIQLLNNYNPKIKQYSQSLKMAILRENILPVYYNTLINFMSVTRKRLDRKHFIQKLQQVKFDWQGQPLKLTFGQTAKHNNSSHSRKSKQKTRQNKHLTQKEQLSNKISRTRYQLDRSKESKQSKQSLPKSSQSYYLTKGKNKRSGSATDKYLERHKSKELTATSNIINSTFQMQSIMNSHKKKQSNFSSTIGSKYEGRTHLKTGVSPQKASYNDELKIIMFKSEAVLERYKSKNEILQQQNKLYKRKYLQALKKIKYLQNRN